MLNLTQDHFRRDQADSQVLRTGMEMSQFIHARIWSGISTSSGAEEFYFIVTLTTVEDSNDKLQFQEGWTNSPENARNYFDIQMYDLHVKHWHMVENKP